MDMKLSVMKPLSARWIISACDYLSTEAGIMRGEFLDAGICEAVAKAESDCDLEGDPFADIDEQWYVLAWCVVQHTTAK